MLNDVGPNLALEAMARIDKYIGADMRLNTFDEAAAYLRAVSAFFDGHTEAEWHKLTTDVLCQDQDGTWRRHRDLKLAVPFTLTTGDEPKVSEALLWATPIT